IGATSAALAPCPFIQVRPQRASIAAIPTVQTTPSPATAATAPTNRADEHSIPPRLCGDCAVVHPVEPLGVCPGVRPRRRRDSLAPTRATQYSGWQFAPGHSTDLTAITNKT